MCSERVVRRERVDWREPFFEWVLSVGCPVRCRCEVRREESLRRERRDCQPE